MGIPLYNINMIMIIYISYILIYIYNKTQNTKESQTFRPAVFSPHPLAVSYCGTVFSPRVFAGKFFFGILLCFVFFGAKMPILCGFPRSQKKHKAPAKCDSGSHFCALSPSAGPSPAERGLAPVQGPRRSFSALSLI